MDARPLLPLGKWEFVQRVCEPLQPQFPPLLPERPELVPVDPRLSPLVDPLEVGLLGRRMLLLDAAVPQLHDLAPPQYLSAR